MTPPSHFPWLGIIALAAVLVVAFGFGIYAVLTW